MFGTNDTYAGASSLPPGPPGRYPHDPRQAGPSVGKDISMVLSLSGVRSGRMVRAEGGKVIKSTRPFPRRLCPSRIRTRINVGTGSFAPSVGGAPNPIG